MQPGNAVRLAVQQVYKNCDKAAVSSSWSGIGYIQTMVTGPPEFLQIRLIFNISK